MPQPKNNSTPTIPAESPPSADSILVSHLRELISACFTGIWHQTDEPHEATSEITDLCRTEGWRIGTWNCDSGIQLPFEPITIPGVTDTQDPLAIIRALPQIAQGSVTTVMVFENLHRFLGSVELVQAVARQIHSGKLNRVFLVVMASVTQIPTEIEKLFVVVEHDLPTHTQLQTIARGVATQEGELP